MKPIQYGLLAGSAILIYLLFKPKKLVPVAPSDEQAGGGGGGGGMAIDPNRIVTPVVFIPVGTPRHIDTTPVGQVTGNAIPPLVAQIPPTKGTPVVGKVAVGQIPPVVGGTKPPKTVGAQLGFNGIASYLGKKQKGFTDEPTIKLASWGI